MTLTEPSTDSGSPQAAAPVGRAAEVLLEKLNVAMRNKETKETSVPSAGPIHSTITEMGVCGEGEEKGEDDPWLR